MDQNFIKNKVVVPLLYLPLILMILLIAIYPLQFFLTDGKVGILNMKSDELLKDTVWKAFFNTHIIFGGLALLIGWTQFNRFFRDRYRRFHRTAGKIYVISVWLSALGVGYIGFYAEGGAIAFFGFITSGFLWAYTTFIAYVKILKGRIWAHQKYMIYSYAICLGAVTLRIWLPLLNRHTHDFIFSYQLVSWISWAPNLVVAYFIIRRLEIRNPIGELTN